MAYSMLSVLDEIGEVNQKLGTLSNVFLKKIVFLGEQHNLKFIMMLDESDCNIFNNLQLQELNKEIAVLNEDLLLVDQQELKLLKSIIGKCLAQGEYSYLKICNVSKQDEIYAPFVQFFE